jgi:hypothetical protein
VLGSEQYFIRWSQSYLRDNFRADTFLTVGAVRDVHVISGVRDQTPLVPDGQQVVGMVLVRTKNNHAARSASP